jgi:Uma2 family endonuclease
MPGTRRHPKNSKAPELVVEVANSSGSIDLHRKKRDYERAGVREFGVVLLRDEEVRRFALRDGIFHDVPSDTDGVYRSQMFPGLWLDAAAFLRLDSAGVLAALRLGLASPGHATFAAELAGRRSRK